MWLLTVVFLGLLVALSSVHHWLTPASISCRLFVCTKRRDVLGCFHSGCVYHSSASRSLAKSDALLGVSHVLTLIDGASASHILRFVLLGGFLFAFCFNTQLWPFFLFFFFPSSSFLLEID